MSIKARLSKVESQLPRPQTQAEWLESALARIDALTSFQKQRYIEDVEEARPRFRPEVQRLLSFLQEHARRGGQ